MNAKVQPLNQTSERDLRAEIVELQQAHPELTRAEISRQSGISSSRLSRYLNGSYPGDVPSLEAELARWVDSYHRREIEAQTLPEAPWFIATRTSERVTAALRYAQIAADTAAIYGASGVGKTRTAEHYQRENPNVWIATMSPATAGLVPALEEIAYALGIEAAGGASRMKRAIIRRLRGTLGLLIVDEADHLKVESFNELRAVQEAADVGVALIGNEEVYTRMTSGESGRKLGRLYSRVGKSAQLKGVSKRDVDAVIAGWGLKDLECREVLHQIAAKPGGLRGLTKTLRGASLFAMGRGEAITCEDIRAAWRERVEE